MYDQDRPDPQVAPVGFEGVALRTPPDAVPDTAPPDDTPPPVTRALFDLGRQRFTVHCAPCHDAAGTGGGIVVQRGFPRPASLHADGQRALSDRAIYTAITAGKGRMAGFADVMPANDAWAVVAWVRALQWSRNARAAELTPSARAMLEERAQEAGR
jgi:mono/diheme cytochrome c family protein